MALLNKDKNYIKLNIDGTYDIYADINERLKEKNSLITFDAVVSKYTEIVNSLLRDEERIYYDAVEWQKEYYAWDNEMQNFIYDYKAKNGASSYPLIEQYFDNVADIIPKVIQSGFIVFNADTVQKIYELSKEYGI